MTHVNNNAAYSFKELGKEGVNVPVGEVTLTVYARDESKLGTVTEVKEFGPISYKALIEPNKEYTLTVNAKNGNVEFNQYTK